MSKSIDLREAAIAYHEAGHTIAETAEVFQVAKCTISEWKKRKKETGNLNNKALNRMFKKIDPEKLRTYVFNKKLEIILRSKIQIITVSCKKSMSTFNLLPFCLAKCRFVDICFCFNKQQ